MLKSLQIRHYLIGEIYQAGTSSIRMPSVREMARRFGVSQSTVSTVTAELIRDGWLRSRPGLGIFTNPEKMADDAEAGLIGVLNGDGCLYYYNEDVFCSFTAFGHAILSRQFHIRNIMLESANPDDMVREVRQQPIRGLIWNTGTVLVSEEPACRLSEAGLPIVADCPHFQKINVVCSDYGLIGRTWADYVRKDTRRHFLFYLPEWHCIQQFTWLYRHEATIVHPGEAIPLKNYDVIITDTPHFRQMRASFPSVEVHDWNVLPDGRRFVPDYGRVAEFAMDRLLRLMQGNVFLVARAILPMKIIR